jgi:hypothetical protein
MMMLYQVIIIKNKIISISFIHYHIYHIPVKRRAAYIFKFVCNVFSWI